MKYVLKTIKEYHVLESFKMSQNLLESYIKQYLKLNEENNLTWGQLKKDVKVLQTKQKVKGTSKALAGFVPYIGPAQDAYDVFTSLVNLPDGKRPQHPLSKFDLDDQLTRISKEKIINQFVSYLLKYIDKQKDITPIEEFDINKVFNEFIKKNYQGRGFAGYKNNDE